MSAALHGSWDSPEFPTRGSNPCSLQWKRQVLTAGPAGEVPCCNSLNVNRLHLSQMSNSSPWEREKQAEGRREWASGPRTAGLQVTPAFLLRRGRGRWRGRGGAHRTCRRSCEAAWPRDQLSQTLLAGGHTTFIKPRGTYRPCIFVDHIIL